MLVESLTFKLSLDFLIYLDTFRIYTSGIKVDFYDRIRHEFLTFNSLSDMQDYWNDVYQIIDDCELGDLCSIQQFSSTSDTFSFNTGYLVSDVSGNYSIIPNRSFDLDRNDQYSQTAQRQVNFLNRTIGEYQDFYNQIKYIYETGIYSPCYAEPGWSENTWWLASLRELINSPSSKSKFPYDKSEIEFIPPE